MQRSLSRKGCPYDNAVAEATFKVIKTEFVWNETFHTLEELKLKLWDYIHWYNHCRIHSSLGYQTPVQYRKNNLKKVVYKSVDNPALCIMVFCLIRLVVSCLLFYMFLIMKKSGKMTERN